MIRLTRPWIEDGDAAAVREILDSGMLVQGAKVRAFEEQLAELCQRQHAVVCSSGTAALELAFDVLALPPGEVICPDFTWPSPAHAIVRADLTPSLVDVSLKTWNSSAERYHEAKSERTVAAVVIDQFGNPAEHDRIEKTLGGLPTIVDAACSLGSILVDRPTASYGTVACLSFHPRKVITTGEGGACLTDDEGLARELRIRRDHGQSGPGVFLRAGGNYRLTDFAAALGLGQLSRLREILRRRRTLAARYGRAFYGQLESQELLRGANSNWQTFGVVLPKPFTTAFAVQRLREAGVEAGRLSYALHRTESLGTYAGQARFENAETLEQRGIALPLYPTMTTEDQDQVIEAVQRLIEGPVPDGDRS